MLFYGFLLSGATAGATYGLRGYVLGWVVFAFFALMLLGQLSKTFRWPEPEGPTE